MGLFKISLLAASKAAYEVIGVLFDQFHIAAYVMRINFVHHVKMVYHDKYVRCGSYKAKC
jgi:hypothetical protein